MKQKKVSNATFYFFSFKKLGEWVWVIDWKRMSLWGWNETRKWGRIEG
jgi:hypothetical protein